MKEEINNECNDCYPFNGDCKSCRSYRSELARMAIRGSYARGIGKTSTDNDEILIAISNGKKVYFSSKKRAEQVKSMCEFDVEFTVLSESKYLKIPTAKYVIQRM